MVDINNTLYSLFFISLLLCLLSCSNVQTQNKPEKSQPNIILINIDDLGYKDTQPYGSTYYQTPNINKLAQSGMTFSRAYAGAANCAPSRACLMSGQNTPRHGIYTVANSDRGKEQSRKLIPIKNNTVLYDTIITLAQMLGDAGYRCGTFGKWHISNDPLKYGFDTNVGGNHRGNPGRDGYFAPYNLEDPQLQNAPKDELLTDRLTDEALLFINKEKTKPYFAYLTYYAVHTPLQTTEALKKKYQSGGNEYQYNATYAGMIETVDKNIGRIIEHLEETDELNNTLIIFTSDNGGIGAISNQHPLRSGKGSYYEGGIRVPLIVSCPPKIKANSKSNHVTSNLDLYPTLQEIVGSKYGNRILDGKSLVPILLGNKLNAQDLFFHFPVYLQAYSKEKDDGRDKLFRTRPGSVLISENWKLHHYFEDDAYELYNLDEDIGERNNLANSRPEITDELIDKLNKWRTNTNSPIPSELNPNFDPDYKG